MKPWMKWGLALLALGVLAASAVRVINGRKAAQAAQAAGLAQSRVAASFALSAPDLAQAQPRELSRTLAVSGGVKAVNTAVVKAKVAAEVKTLLVREGDSVKAGQVIGQLDTTELALRLRQAEQTAASSRAQLDIARRALENSRALVAQGFISSTGLETSVSNEAAAQATYGAAVAAVELARKAVGDAQLVAPISGRVSQRLVQPGERVGVDARLIEVVDLSRIELEAAVSPEDAGAVRVGQTARLEIDGLEEAMQARVARINPSTQAGTRAVMVYLTLAPHPGLRQGLFAKGTLEVERRTVLTVPLSTVRVDQPRPYVLTVENGTTLQRTVTTGLRGAALVGGVREDVVEVKDGLSPGATVLRASVGSMRDGTAVTLPAASASAPAAPASAASH